MKYAERTPVLYYQLFIERYKAVIIARDLELNENQLKELLSYIYTYQQCIERCKAGNIVRDLELIHSDRSRAK